jgi:hypothetical protein
MAALAKANGLRFGRAVVKRKLREGRITLADALAHPYCQSMSVFDLLCAQRQWGRRRVLSTLNRLADEGFTISETRRVEMLTDREREALVDAP